MAMSELVIGISIDVGTNDIRIAHASKENADADVVPYTRCAIRSGASSLTRYCQIGLYSPAMGNVT